MWWLIATAYLALLLLTLFFGLRQEQKRRARPVDTIRRIIEFHRSDQLTP